SCQYAWAGSLWFYSRTKYALAIVERDHGKLPLICQPSGSRQYAINLARTQIELGKALTACWRLISLYKLLNLCPSFLRQLLPGILRMQSMGNLKGIEGIPLGLWSPGKTMLQVYVLNSQLAARLHDDEVAAVVVNVTINQPLDEGLLDLPAEF